MKFYLAGLAAILLCLGQTCSSSSLLSSLTSGTDTTGTTDTSSDSTDSTTSQNLGVPQGAYSGSNTTDFSLDNLSDSYPAQTSTNHALATFFFDSTGKLLRADGRPLAVGDTQYTDTQIGRIYETVTAVNLATQVYQYRTDATMAMEGQGLTWNFTGSGLYSFRYSGGHLLYDGELGLTSDTAGGASYEAIWTLSATLAP